VFGVAHRGVTGTEERDLESNRESIKKKKKRIKVHNWKQKHNQLWHKNLGEPCNQRRRGNRLQDRKLVA